MTVQGPVKEQQPNGMSHGGGGGVLGHVGVCLGLRRPRGVVRSCWGAGGLWGWGGGAAALWGPQVLFTCGGAGLCSFEVWGGVHLFQSL